MSDLMLRNTQSPVTTADVDDRSVGATARTAPLRKLYQRALGLSRSRTARHFNGDDEYSPSRRFLRAVHDLQRGDGTTAWPLIGEAVAIALQIETAEPQSLRHLEQRLAELTTAFTDLLPEVIRQEADADLIAAELLFVRAAIRREISSRQGGARWQR